MTKCGVNKMCCAVVLSDVVSIEKTGENFRLIYDVKGRFTVHRITNEEAKVSLMFLCSSLKKKLSDKITSI